MSRGVPGRRGWLFLAVALLLAALFTGLGLWQLDRHGQAEARNERKRARLSAPALRLGVGQAGEAGEEEVGQGEAGGERAPARPGVVDPAALPSLPAEGLRWRKLRARGRYDFTREVVLSARSYHGIPGVYVVTPLVVSDSVALPVLRGWLPAPDGYHAPLEAGRGEVAGELTVEGVLLPGMEEPPGRVDTLRTDGGHPVLNTLHLPTLRRLLPYRIPDLYLQSLAADSAARVVPPPEGLEERITPPRGDGEAADAAADREAAGEKRIRLPLPLESPEPSAGGHLSYALQWFAFALVALVGGGIFVWRTGEEDAESSPGEEAV